MRSRSSCAALLALACSAGSCVTPGPSTIPRDRIEYVDALRESWKRLILLNIVGLRYAEIPLLVDVTSVIEQYSVEGEIDGVNADVDSIGGALRASARPTITYIPLTGEKVTQSLLTPIAPAAVVGLVQSGWPVALVFRVAVQSLNGVGTIKRGESPRFLELLARMQRVQDSGAFGVRVVRSEDKSVALLVLQGDAAEEVAEDLDYIHTELALDPAATEYALEFGRVASGPGELAMLTRSLLDVLIQLSLWVEVEPADIADGKAMPMQTRVEVAGQLVEPLIRIRSGASPPDFAFASVRYRDRWYWIDDSDFASKRCLTFAMLMLSMAESSSARAGPVVTVSAGG